MFEGHFGWIIGAAMLPVFVWLIITARGFLRSESGTPARRRYGIALCILGAAGILIAIQLIVRTVRWGIGLVIEESILLTLFLGFPLTAVSIFFPALIRYKRSPKDAPERQRNKRIFVISGVIAAILTAAAVTLFIIAAIGIAHM